MVNLPRDILSDILIRLPVKSIARFRCVNNEWLNLLKSSEFLKTQYQHAVEMDKFSIMLPSNGYIDTLSYDPFSSTCEESSHDIRLVESTERGIEFLGCCNGLVLLKHVNKFHSCVLMLWNPCSNECKRVPNPPGASKDRSRMYVEYGLAYDYQIEDFKVVCLAESLNNNWCKVHVYTLKSNSWRRVHGVKMDDFSDRVFSMARLPVNGSLHWIINEEGTEFRNDRFILCFDIEKEKLDKMPLDILDDAAEPFLCVLCGSLCLFCYDSKVISVWVSKDNGVMKSWAKLFTIELEKHFGEVYNYIPLQSLKNGKILLGLNLGDYLLHMVIYDPKQDLFLDIHQVPVVSSLRVAVYMERLISLDTGIYLGPAQWKASHKEDEANYKDDADVDDVDDHDSDTGDGDSDGD
ncbi:F-box/kelch-repeat protein At3g23880-like [Papaver somniferum]|uniref:F-box/kelch-repeat protein At3g23880-like n=1 Tax=Papaver somniferum TaxID=3469 RepID=UPI000E70340C|nr:F-box/kelch-repeat protein At3g23880-like [Papaver somniferum]